MAEHKKQLKHDAHTEEHRPWELETQTEGLDELQGERLEKEPKKKPKHAKA